MTLLSDAPKGARRIHVRGIVQGVGFRPFVYRLARAHDLAGWVLNGDDGVHIHVEGVDRAIEAFIKDLRTNPPPAAQVVTVDIAVDDVEAASGFEILRSRSDRPPTTRIAPDLPICDDCRREMLDPVDRRSRYAYINCTNCGPRYSIVRSLPYDRAGTTMAEWPLCEACGGEYHDPGNRRFHAQPVACPSCGPSYRLISGSMTVTSDAIAHAARLLREGQIVAVKGIGGYHLSCDADNAGAVARLRERKYRKEQPFAVMVRDLVVAERTAHLGDHGRELLESPARPIVVAPARDLLPGIAPEIRDIGVMLPYAPLHVLLFDAGAPDRLVMTSGNRSSEPIAYLDDDAVERLNGLADAMLVGERPIARRVDDSVVRVGALGPMVLRRSRGLAPGAVVTLPTTVPILALGGDLKNAVTIVVDGQAYVSQHIGDLSHLAARRAFQDTIQDLLAMYAIRPDEITIVHDQHPEYASSALAPEVGARMIVAVQHHRAHVASVLAEREAMDRRVLGVALDGTGYGDDGTVWGGEFFVGSVADGFTRIGHLRQARLAGGDAAAQFPVQAAAGFLAEVDDLGDLAKVPFRFPARYQEAAALIEKDVRVFRTTSMGRLFDAVAALVGFTRPITYEGQAAIWLEHLARREWSATETFACPFVNGEVDWREALADIVDARRWGGPPDVIARGFHRGLARGIADAVMVLAEQAAVDTVVFSGGVMQNQLLLEDLVACLAPTRLQLWLNRAVPPNDGGLSLGQAALAACGVCDAV